MPQDFPNWHGAVTVIDPIQRVAALEHSFGQDIGDPRFIPFIQLYEFEALLFSEPSSFGAAFPGRHAEIQKLELMRSLFLSPEYIDGDEPPSRRMCAVFPDYNKAVYGALIANTIGLSTIARECAHFRHWLQTLRLLDAAV